MAKHMYLSSWINFGKYKRSPTNLKKIIDTKEGRTWLKWLIGNTWNFTFDKTVVEYLKQKEEEYDRSLLQSVGGQ